MAAAARLSHKVTGTPPSLLGLSLQSGPAPPRLALGNPVLLTCLTAFPFPPQVRFFSTGLVRPATHLVKVSRWGWEGEGSAVGAPRGGGPPRAGGAAHARGHPCGGGDPHGFAVLRMLVAPALALKGRHRAWALGGGQTSLACGCSLGCREMGAAGPYGSLPVGWQPLAGVMQAELYPVLFSQLHWFPPPTLSATAVAVV